MSRNAVKAMAALTVGVLLAAGCGSSDRGADSSAGSEPSAPAAGAAAPVTFGDLESPCGEGDGGPAVPDEGVGADTITIGYGDDAGFTGSPGLSKDITDAVEAIVEWCNEQGGINGREIVGKYYDAKITEAANAATQACTDRVFMLVGEGWALDSGQEQARLGCGLPAVPAYSVSPEFGNGQLMYAALPNPADEVPTGVINWYAAQEPEKAQKIGIFSGNYAVHQFLRDKALAGWPEHGAGFLDCRLEYNITGEADWKPFARKLEDCGAEVVYWIGSPFPFLANFLEAADQLGYHPDVLADANTYDESLRKWNTAGFGDRVHLALADVPFEAADEHAATKQYLELIEEHGGKATNLGAHGVSAFLLWATATDACGADVTRACVLENLASTHEWTGGGLHGVTDPGGNHLTPCAVVLRLDGTGWEQLEPGEPGELSCEPANATTVSGPFLDRLALGADRVFRPGG